MMNNNAPASTKRLILFIALVAANVIALVAGILLILPNLGKADETSAAVEETSGRERQTARPGNTATPKPEATPEATEPTPEALPEGALSIEDIMGVYEYLDDYAEPQAVQVREILGDLMIRFKGSENEYKYDPLSGVATYSYEDLPGRPNEITMLFEVDGGNMAVTIDTLHTHPDGSETRERYDGYRVDPPGVPDGSDEDQAPELTPEAAPSALEAAGDYSTTERTTIADVKALIEMTQGSEPDGVRDITELEEVLGGWKGMLIDDEGNVADSSYISLFNVNIEEGRSGQLEVTLDWHRIYSSLDEDDYRDDEAETETFECNWTSEDDYAILRGSSLESDSFMYLDQFIEYDGKQYAAGRFEWWDGWELFMVLVRP